MNIERIAKMLIAQLGLKTKISYEITEGMKGAAGFYMPQSDTIHLNITPQKGNFCVSSQSKNCGGATVDAIFTVVHEIRHAQQYAYPHSFSALVRKNLNYVLMYDGSAYKRTGDRWKTCQLKGESGYLLELYALSPMEIDANDFAYAWLSRYACQNGLDIQGEIDKVYDFWKPPFKYINEGEYEKIYNALFDFIEINAK